MEENPEQLVCLCLSVMSRKKGRFGKSESDMG